MGGLIGRSKIQPEGKPHTCEVLLLTIRIRISGNDEPSHTHIIIVKILRPVPRGKPCHCPCLPWFSWSIYPPLYGNSDKIPQNPANESNPHFYTLPFWFIL